MKCRPIGEISSGSGAPTLDLDPGRSASMSLLRFALFFLVLAGIAAVFGFSGLAQGSADVAKVLVLIFLVIFAIIGVLSMTVFKTVT
jgi:uncharacterized membrane protein YtjA (UPF0391 family)